MRPWSSRRDRVIDERRVAPRQPDQDRRSAVSGVARKLLGRLARRLLQRGLQHQVLERIAGEVELGEGDQVRAGCCRAGADLAGPGHVAGKVADDGV